MHIDRFREMYVAELQEARSVEAMLAAALGKMAEAASDEELRKAFRTHREETVAHGAQVETILKRLKAGPLEHKDQAMQSIVREAEKMMGITEPGPLRDAALIASAQRVEHYEIALYGTLATYASSLGLEEDARQLGDILEDEKATDEELSDIAEGIVNPSAIEAG
ncbi:ferritin-like domain-containing protein [Propylenella binzhouense]|nr:DUF892 family protein [Propylenella binzhouense]